MAETREPGWYEDPWGTPEDRYFDGSAWTRQTRPSGSTATRAAGPTNARAAPAPTEPNAATVVTPAAPVAERPTAPAPRGTAAGWFADPWGEAAWRWWDGTQWTGYTERVAVSGAVVAAELENERRWARWARVGMALYPVFQVFALIATTIQWRWIADHYEAFSKGSTPPTPSSATALGYFSLPALGIVVLLILWLYRAGATARAAGLPLRRDPGLGAVSFIIPVLNFWWPYRAVRDALGAGNGAEPLVVRWWAAWIVSALGGLLVLLAAFLPAAFSILAVAVVAGVSVAAAIAGRAVVAAVLASHESLAVSVGAS